MPRFEKPMLQIGNLVSIKPSFSHKEGISQLGPMGIEGKYSKEELRYSNHSVYISVKVPYPAFGQITDIFSYSREITLYKTLITDPSTSSTKTYWMFEHNLERRSEI